MFCHDADDIQAFIKEFQQQALDKGLSRGQEGSLPWPTLPHCRGVKTFFL